MIPHEADSFCRALQSFAEGARYHMVPSRLGDKSEVADESEALSLAIQGIYADVDAEPGAAGLAHEVACWQLEPAGPCFQNPHGGASPLSSNEDDDSFSENSFEDDDLLTPISAPAVRPRGGLQRMRSTDSLVDLAASPVSQRSVRCDEDMDKHGAKGAFARGIGRRSSSCCTLMELGEEQTEHAAASEPQAGMKKVVSLDSMILTNMGLCDSEVAAASSVYGANRLPRDLPDIPTPTMRAIAYLCALRPVAVGAGVLSSLRMLAPALLHSQGRTPRLISAAVLGLSAAAFGTARLLEHYVSAFDRLREHVRLAQYALHRVRRGEEEEELSLVTREGTQKWIPCSDLVPGDVVHLQEGRVPADCQLISACDLRMTSPIAKLPIRNSILLSKDGSCVVSKSWWSTGEEGGEEARSQKSDAHSALGIVEGGQGVALGTSIVKSGKATAIVTRIGKSVGVYLLLSRLSSLSLLEMLMLYPCGGV